MSSNILTRDIDVTKVNFFCSATCFDTLAYAFPIIISILDHYPFEKDLQKLDLGGKHYHVKEKSSKKIVIYLPSRNGSFKVAGVKFELKREY